MDSILTHKETILTWHQGVTAFDRGSHQESLDILLQIPEASITSRIFYNIGHIYLFLQEYTKAAKNFEAAFEKDCHLAAAFFQCGVALFRNNKFNQARKMFEKSKECLRDSQYIDYKAVGMTCKLYRCEILFNISTAVAAMTKDPEWALDILSDTDKCEKEPNHVQSIQKAKNQLKDGVTPSIFSLPEKELFRPPKDKIENINKTDYLGQSKVVHTVPGSSVKKPAKQKEEKVIDLPIPKRSSLEPPSRKPPGSNMFKPINSQDSRSSPTPPNRLPPSPTSPFNNESDRLQPSNGKFTNPSGRSSPVPPGRPPPSGPGGRPSPSPTPPMRPPPMSSGRPSPSPPARLPPQSFERLNSAGKGPPARPPPISPSNLSPQPSPINSRGPSPNKLSHKEIIVTWHKAMQVYESGATSEALENLTSIPEPSAKILFNIGSFQLLTNDVANAQKTLELAVEKDEHMAIGFFQQGIALAQQSSYELAWKAFDKARRALRQNDSIDYKQIGLPYKLYECEVLYNQSLMYYHLDDMKLAKEVLELALKKKSEIRHSKIDSAMVQLKASKGFDLFTLPKDAVFKPPASKVENISKVDYLGQKKVVAKFEEKEVNGRPSKLPPRLSMDLGNKNKHSEEKRRSSSPGIRISYHGSLDEDANVFRNEMSDNRCNSPPDLDEEGDTYGPVPEGISSVRIPSLGTLPDIIDVHSSSLGPLPDVSILRSPSPGPPARPAPTPPLDERAESPGPPARDAPAPPVPLKRGEDLDELYANVRAKKYNNVALPKVLSPTADKKPFPSPKPKRF